MINKNCHIGKKVGFTWKDISKGVMFNWRFYVSL